MWNLLAVVSDNIHLNQDSTWTSLINTTDYYPFGLAMDGRSVQESAYRYLYNGKELLDDLNLNLYDFGERYFDPVIGRWTSPDPMASERSWVSPYNYVQNNPILRVDPDGRLDDWYKNIDGEVKFDDKIKSQRDLDKGGINGTYLSADKYDRKVVDAIGADITANSGGWNTFMKYYENSDLGKGCFMDAAMMNYNDNASGLMGFFANKMTGVREGIRLSMMAHDWVGQAGWTERRNQLEHHIGMFLMADRFGPDRAQTIGTLNEYRGFWINDRQSGNMWNALTGRPGTAFEWSDLRYNNEGINKWYNYNKIDRYPALNAIPRPGTLEFEMTR